MSQRVFSGVLTALATPFASDGRVDENATRKLLGLQKKAGVSGVVMCGTTGESPTLDDEEKMLLVRLALAERTDDFRVYVGVGTNDTRSTVESARRFAAARGPNGTRPDGIMCVVPYYNKPTQAGLLAHFSAVAEALGDVPLCVYNVPGRTACTLAPSTFELLVERHANVRAIKEAAGDVRVVTELALMLRRIGKDKHVELLSGDDPTFAPALACGATGVISVSTHVFPKAMVDMLQAARRNDLETLRDLQLKTLDVHTHLFTSPNPVPLKWALAWLGVCDNRLRLPLVALSDAEAQSLKKALEHARALGIELSR